MFKNGSILKYNQYKKSVYWSRSFPSYIWNGNSYNKFVVAGSFQKNSIDKKTI